MHGSLSLGKEVMDTLTHYFRRGNSPVHISGRRYLNANLNLIPGIVKSATLCKNLEFCKGKKKFVDEFVIQLAQAVEDAFDGVLNYKTNDTNLGEGKPIFGQLKACLKETRKILKIASEKVNENREESLWVGVIKRISAKFHKESMSFMMDTLDTNELVIVEIKRKLTQSLIINFAKVELDNQRRLCYEFHVCFNHNECTTLLNMVLGRIIKLPDEKIKAFIKAFYEELPDTAFYSSLNPVTADEFKIILNDMVYTDDVPTREILTSVHEIVETRINTMYTSAPLKKGQDIQLLHTILSDMDYLYSKQKDRFHGILDGFLEWIKEDDVNVSPHIKEVFERIERKMSSTPEELALKLINEVRVFLEITVDPDKNEHNP